MTLDAVVVLAAGEGTRMRSAVPKVLHEVAGRSLLGHVLAAVGPLGARRTLVVVGAGREAVTASLPPGAQAVVQEEQRGTGHAVRTALDAAPDVTGTVLVLYGDMPLLTTETLRSVAAAPTVLTARLADPTGYGRILRGADGRVTGVVEERDATPEQRAIDEVNAGVYAFEAASLREALSTLGTGNAQGEEYLTDVVGSLDLRAVEGDPQEVAGVNDRAQLAAAGAVLRDRVVRAAQLAGVTVTDPLSTWVDVTVTLEPDAVVEPFTILRGTTRVESGAVVGPYSRLVDTTVGAGATVLSSTCTGAEIGPQANVGPYSYLRPGTRLGRRAKAGGFVEMKNAVVGDGSKVPHLSYVGDTTIGTGSNVGAGTITVNYDGVEKHRTTIGDDVRIGSDTMLVAPVTIGDTAYTAAGSVITQDVPPGSLGVGRARQRNVDGWVARRRGTDDDGGAAE